MREVKKVGTCSTVIRTGRQSPGAPCRSGTGQEHEVLRPQEVAAKVHQRHGSHAAISLILKLDTVNTHCRALCVPASCGWPIRKQPASKRNHPPPFSRKIHHLPETTAGLGWLPRLVDRQSKHDPLIIIQSRNRRLSDMSELGSARAYCEPDTSQHCACPVMLLRFSIFAIPAILAGTVPAKILGKNAASDAYPKGKRAAEGSIAGGTTAIWPRNRTARARSRLRICDLAKPPVKPVHHPVPGLLPTLPRAFCIPAQLPAANRFHWMRWAETVCRRGFQDKNLGAPQRNEGQAAFPFLLYHMLFSRSTAPSIWCVLMPRSPKVMHKQVWKGPPRMA